MNAIKQLRTTTTCALTLAFLVVMLGAYTRLTNAGLGCPDWPGCYGHMILAAGQHSLIDTVKAWTEMVHRYAAGTLALLILGIAIGVIRARREGIACPWKLPLTLLFLVAFQAALGMWTVTLKLLPVVVMGHLLGGILIFTCLCYFRWQLSGIRTSTARERSRYRAWVIAGIAIVFCQIALGGWVSSNYAGIACIGFPRCNGQWFPVLHLSRAFNLFSSVGTNYQGGVLDNEVRMTIQYVHRLGAYVTALYMLLLSGFMLGRARAKPLRRMALIAILLVLMQFSLGIINVVYLLPLWAAVAHNGLAALLLASMVSLYYLASGYNAARHPKRSEGSPVIKEIPHCVRDDVEGGAPHAD